MTSFPKVSGAGNKKVVYTGLPVRHDFIERAGLPLPLKSYVLITGGSLGAQVLDDVVPQAFLQLSPALKKKVFITHQTRPENVARLQKIYSDNKIRANVLSFIHDMADVIASSDLVIGRSGASTVVELQTIGRPAIFVPLRINPDQIANAENFTASGGGFMVPQDKFTPKWLSSTLADLFNNPARLTKMAQKALVKNNAVDMICQEIVSE
jgi:UDP-N-acetylglucosamine--N-acetylmuramyl-(pentapeptide) pyrophosphoryl-undecaprenol N-acetylglucosamine transferase